MKNNTTIKTQVFNVFSYYVVNVTKIRDNLNRDKVDLLVKDIRENWPFLDKKMSDNEVLSKFNWFEELDINHITPCPHCFEAMLKMDYVDLDIKELPKSADDRLSWNVFFIQEKEEIDMDNLLPMHPWCINKIAKQG